ncbi:MAG: pilus assembly protein PilQ [Gammaproteobacteria bacterium RIFCSPLOWO2_02_FULL_61_13]|nr:MAG: pilus assembly protein PilQ [Gammaproteobacteria bacterium RIFCSPLOWO2_02_FULL_61_13]
MTQKSLQAETDHGFLGRAAARALASVLLAGFFTAANSATLDGASFSAMPGDRVQLKLDFSEPLTEEPVNFTIDNPARIAIDLPGVGLKLAEKSQSIGIGMAHSLAAVEADGRTRVVINLVHPVSYDMELQDKSLIVTLGAAVTGSETKSAMAPASAGGAPMASGDGGSIENIDFRRGDDGEGRIVITLSDPSVGVNMGQESGQIVVDFLGASLPAELDRKLDVVDFATPVKIIDTKPNAGGTRMSISTTTEQYDHLAYQADNTFTIEVRPLTADQQDAMKKEKFGFTGERLSLNFQDIEVRAVLQLIADFTGLNLVASDTVRGSVTLRLKNVPWDQALDIILRARGLGLRQDGNVMMVAPQEEIAAREKLELESQKQVEELAPLRTEFVQINYAKAADLATLIRSEENNLLSERGNVSIDDRTNTLIIQDVGTSLEAIRDMVSKLDIPIRQVLIESRIVNADESFTRDLGVKFGGAKQDTTADGDKFGYVGGTREGVFAEEQQPVGTVTGADGLLVNLPVPGATSALALAVGKVGSFLLQLELSALLAEGRGEEIANPRVITANQSEASIESGVEIPYQAATSSGATSVSFKKAVLSLRVTPQITPDDRVLLDLLVNQDTRGSPDVLGTPPINTRSVQTQVLVDDGETVVLGGIFNQTDRTSTDRVPFFSDVPVLGVLFKKNRIEKSRTELLIFVTPKILREDLAI